MIKKAKIIVYLLSATILTKAQSNGLYTQYFFNQQQISPAVVGYNDYIQTTAIVRTQWLGQPNNPISQSVGVDLPLPLLQGGIGLQINNEKAGLDNTSSITLNYAYRKKIKKQSISLGIGVGFLQKSIHGNELRTPQGIYGSDLFSHNDPILNTNKESTGVLDLSVGAYYQSPKFSLGISSVHLAEPAIELSNTSISLKRQYNFVAQYHEKINSSLSFSPRLLVRSTLINTQVDLSLILEHESNVYGGFSLRGITEINRDALSLIIGYRLNNKLTVGYSYDFPISKMLAYSTGSHEFYINFNIDLKNKKSIYTYYPRIE